MSKTTKTRILEVLKQHPKGLPRSKLFHLLGKEYAACEDTLSSILAMMVKERTIKNEDGEPCPECYTKKKIYKYRPQY